MYPRRPSSRINSAADPKSRTGLRFLAGLASALAGLMFAAPLVPAAPGGWGGGPGGDGRPGADPAREDRVIVRVKEGHDLSSVHRRMGTHSRRIGHRAPRRHMELVDVPRGRGREEVLQALRSSGDVEYAEPDFAVHALVEPNDFRFWDGSNWHLKNKGIYGGTIGSDIHAAAAWDTIKDAPNFIVAVVDTGVRYTHEDLRQNLWVNPGESGLDANNHDKASNGIDDDGDGWVDDVHGINTLNHSGDPNDDFGHGTHVCAILGATTNNGVGIAGVAWRVQIMALKFLDSQGNGTISDAIECMEYARSKGARVINASWGSYAFTSQALRDEIDSLRADGIIFVAACGNSHSDNDANPLFPASYEFDNIISVAATTRDDSAASFTNWGSTTVDLAAPGAPVFSAWNRSDSDYRYLDGTSMAAPQVSGAIALLWTLHPELDYHQVIQQIVSNTDPLPAFAGKTVSGGRLDLEKVLTASLPASNPPGDDDPPPPPPPPPSTVDYIWSDDAIPAGAWMSTSGGDTWTWVTSGPAPYSGAKAHQSAIVAGYHDHSFNSASDRLPIATGDTLFLYVYIDPQHPPREIFVSWNNGSWDHRAYWGDNLINYGTNGTAGRRSMGAIPAAGQWVRLEVPASLVGLEGSEIRSMSFSLYDGRVTWDAVGVNMQVDP